MTRTIFAVFKKHDAYFRFLLFSCHWWLIMGLKGHMFNPPPENWNIKLKYKAFLRAKITYFFYFHKPKFFRILLTQFILKVENEFLSMVTYFGPLRPHILASPCDKLKYKAFLRAKMTYFYYFDKPNFFRISLTWFIL